MIRIIDHKKIDLTNSEYDMYQHICKSNDRPAFKGASLFEDHFEVNGDGIIIFVKPPHKKYSSMEVYCFLVSVMCSQHIRIMHEQNDQLVKEAEKKLKELFEDTQNKISELVESSKSVTKKKK